LCFIISSEIIIESLIVNLIYMVPHKSLDSKFGIWLADYIQKLAIYEASGRIGKRFIPSRQ